ncbi:MAG: hypothetical protein NVS4B8_25500 [Herpetosiphon sp.]
MEWNIKGSDVFVRLDPGNQLVASLRHVADELSLDVAAITSGVGMLDGVELGFFNMEKGDYDGTTFDGIFDLNSVMGNIVRRDGVAIPHVHLVFNNAAHQTWSGHLLEAVCHITMEIFLSTSTLELKRVKLEPFPATRIVGCAGGQL